MTAPVLTQPPRKRQPLPPHKQQLEEARRMAAVPGIVFIDGYSERVPVIERTAVEVWEVIGVFKYLEGDVAELYASLDWSQQVDAALAYYRAYPAEVDQCIAENDRYEPEAGNVTYPIQL